MAPGLLPVTVPTAPINTHLAQPSKRGLAARFVRWLTTTNSVIPDAVIDRPKGYFPVPALKHVRGPFLQLIRGILQSKACMRRGLYQRAYVDKLLANPGAHFTRIQGSKLWHLALLEWWLQAHVDGVLGRADAAART